MNVLITGGAGFLGQKLLHELLCKGTLVGPSGRSEPIEKITLLDIFYTAPFRKDERLEVVVGNVADAAVLRTVISKKTSSIFHLASVVSGQAELDFDLGMKVNIDATRLLLDVCREVGQVPRIVFTSSVAVYGGVLPELVEDTTALNPQSSYGAQKTICEIMISDYHRKGFVNGRVARLPTISVRPGKPNQAASSFASGIIREPLNGQISDCPVSRDTRLWLMSPSTAISCLIAVHDLPGQLLGSNRAINLPGLSVTPDDMHKALGRVAGEDVASRIRWIRNPQVEQIVGSWPGAWNSSRALEMALPADSDFDSFIREFMENKEQFAGARISNQTN